jgi:hypothetical protein
VVLQGDKAQVEARLSLFGDSANLDIRLVRSLCLALQRPMELLGEWVIWNLVSVHLEIVSMSLQYRCMVCTEHTLGSKIVLDTPDGTPRGRGSSGSSFQYVCG